MKEKLLQARAALGQLAKVALRRGHAALDAVEEAVDAPARRAVREAVLSGGAPPPAAGMPPKGLSRVEIFANLEAYKSFDVEWRDGRTWAYVYDAGGETAEICKQAYAMYLGENGLDPTAFPSVLQLENEVVGMVSSVVHLPAGGAGSFTSGGTESIFMAVKAARDHARRTRPEVARPRILLPHTAHASFHKAAHYMGLEVDLVPVDPESFKADVAVMRAAIRPETILMVGSACSYAHGVVDPIPELGALALETGVWLHVDACIGGFVLHYFRRLGAEVTPFDFEVPGVTSLSMDLHKYGFSAKGASLVYYRDRALREFQFYACSHWSGYTVINTTIQSSKSAGPVAGAWAVLKHFGDEGYLALFRSVLDSTRRVAAGIREKKRLRLLAEPESNLVAFTSDEVDVFHLADEMRRRGWYVQPQLGFEATKENIHLSVNPKAERWIETFLADLDSSVDAAAALPSGELAARVREEFGDLAGSSLSAARFRRLLELVGIDGVTVPDRMAPVNEVLNALPPETREEMLKMFLNEIFTAPGPRT